MSIPLPQAHTPYDEVLAWMYSRLPMFQRIGAAAYRPDLHNIQALCERLGQPQFRYPVIHVGGTNGKGSVSHLLASVLQTAGYRVGLYTSPHLKDYRERIRVNGQWITPEAVVAFMAAHAAFMAEQGLSFFEMTVGLAFDAFAQQNVDVAVIEVGLGGQLDATNVVDPVLSVITNISLDHTDLLGDTLALIAAQKAGIIKPEKPVIIGQTTPETELVFRKVAQAQHSPLHLVNQSMEALSCGLMGHYQRYNVRTVMTAVNQLRTQGYAITDAQLQQGLMEVVTRTGLRGRWEVLGNRPLVIADTAHNEAGLREVLAQLQTVSFGQLHWVLGKVADKNSAQVLALMPTAATYYFCRPDIPRGQDAALLQAEAQVFGLQGDVYASVQKALAAALAAAKAEDLVLVAGSNFTVAEILP